MILPRINNCSQITLDIGEDRIVLDTRVGDGGKEYHLDVFVPVAINSDGVTATFDVRSKVLQLMMPLLLWTK